MQYKLYLLGLLLTDGWFYGGAYSIELKSEDKDVLYQIGNRYTHCKIRERTRDTNFAKNYSCTQIDIRNKEIKEFVSNYYPEKDKTLNAAVPEEFLLSPSLWRGLLDGDGSYGYRKDIPFVSFTTKSEKLKEAFCYIIKEITGQVLRASRNVRDDIYNLGVTSINAKTFVQWLLSEDTFYIPRKKERMESISAWQPKGKQGIKTRLWTKEEEDFLYTHTNEECLQYLNRTLCAIKARRNKLNRERREE